VRHQCVRQVARPAGRSHAAVGALPARVVHGRLHVHALDRRVRHAPEPRVRIRRRCTGCRASRRRSTSRRGRDGARRRVGWGAAGRCRGRWQHTGWRGDRRRRR
jgi:hypothetical protein